MITNQIKIRSSDRQEDLQRVSPGFPISVYQTDFSRHDYQCVNWHWHNDFQLCLVTRGSVLFHVVSQTRVIPAGVGIFINKKLAHTAEPDTEGAAYYCIDFHPDMICIDQYHLLKEKILAPFESDKTLPCFLFDNTEPSGRTIIETIYRMIDLSERKEGIGWELLLQSEVLRLWPTILSISQGHGIRVNFQSNQRMQKIISYLNEHYNEKVTLEAVAQEVFLCPEECTRFLKKITGKTVFQYLMQYRIEKSQELLRYSDMTIAEIAAHTGFSTQSYFSLCFQKKTGFTPNQYRKEMQSAISGD